MLIHIYKLNILKRKISKILGFRFSKFDKILKAVTLKQIIYSINNKLINYKIKKNIFFSFLELQKLGISITLSNFRPQNFILYPQAIMSNIMSNKVVRNFLREKMRKTEN